MLAILGCPASDQGAQPGGTGGVMTADDGGDSSTGAPGVDSTGGDDGMTGACVTNDDCALSPGLETCDPASGECVGCIDDDDCTGDLVCNAGQLCEGCDGDHECPLGTTCSGGVCSPGCSDEQPCPAGFACCGDVCADLDSNPQFCGDCETQCPAPANAEAACNEGACGVGECAEGFIDCNGMGSDGCEGMGDCSCTPGAQEVCYTGDPATQNVGACMGGVQTCLDDGSGWGPCTGEVVPIDEVCANAVDDDCDGAMDEDLDDDGDGFTVCGGDCCDEQGPDCLNPELVNAGAFEVDGNRVDDDCDGMVDNPVAACDAGLVSNSADPDDYARAIDLCQFTEEAPADPADETWGVISTQLQLTSGAGNPAANSRSIRDGFGANNANQFGDRLAVLSTGFAADNLGDAMPGFAVFQEGQNMNTTAAFPADWLGANGGNLPNAAGCPEPGGSAANDPVMLRLRVRVPTNANSFSVAMSFFSAEYPEYVCTQFNDFFVALVDSSDPGNPPDKNIAIYDDGANTWPVGVNILSAAPGLFTQCVNGSIGQCGTVTNYNGCTGTTALTGSGFDQAGATTFSCGYSGFHGGGTGWLTMSGNVTPGEIMEIRFAIWDTSDHIYDSLVLLDNWQWSVQASDPGVAPS
jgi:hypothetical protein